MTDIIKILTGRLLGLGSGIHEIDAWILFLSLFTAMGLMTVFLLVIWQIWRMTRLSLKVNKLRMCFTEYKENVLKDQIEELKKKLRRKEKRKWADTE